ncbi:MAG TPA: hypothetical protein VK404_01870 [Spirosoma sp.]|nr:hypothetical protein [Spirosoma sp.]
MKSYQAKAGQNIFDICLQLHGNFDQLYQFIIDSGLDNINSTIPLGYVFYYQETTEVLPVELKRRGITIATAHETPLTAPGAFNQGYNEEFD